MMANRSFAFFALGTLLAGALLAGCGDNTESTPPAPQLPASNVAAPTDAPSLKSGPPAGTPAR